MTVVSICRRALTQVATRGRIVARPATVLTRMTRYRGGTYSHTVDTIVFTDGTRARTDLIRLTPTSMPTRWTSPASHRTIPSRYRLGTWSALPHLRSRDYEAEVDWILRHSFPLINRRTEPTDARSRLSVGSANINEHEAIAGTQAAIWYLTNGLALDTQPLNVPVAVRRGPDR